MKKLLILFILFQHPVAFGVGKTLFDWNTGSNKDLPGWEWSNDLGYGAFGWKLVGTDELGLPKQFSNGVGPRSMNKTDYGNANDVIIDTQNRAPSTSEGGSLKVFSTSVDKDKSSTWWVWYDGEPLSYKGITNEFTDRMSFYLKLEGTKSVADRDLPTSTAEVGTYLCWPPSDGSTAYGSGDGCPYEGKGNQHYYHWMSADPGAWIHVLLDQNPQHLRGEADTAGNNPSKITHNKNYFEHLNQFYIQTAEANDVNTSLWVDEVEFYSTKDTEEPIQNELSINSLWIGYWKDSDEWHMGFNDESFGTGSSVFKTYQIKYDVKPITNETWANANPIEPLVNGGIAAAGDKYLLRNANSWKKVRWTRFKIPNDIEQVNDIIYFAVKDVSEIGKHAGTSVSYVDTHDSASSYVKTINYSLRPSVPRPKPPSNVN